MAQSSLEETKYHLILSKDLAYLEKALFDELLQQLSDEVGKMLYAYRARLIPNHVFA